MSTSLPKIAVVTNIVPDYRYPVFAALMNRSEADWRIFVTLAPEQSCERARNLLPLFYSRAHHIWLSTRHPSGTIQREPLPLPLRLPVDLWRYRPRLIIGGEFGLRSILCWAAARLLGVPFVLWSEEILSSAHGRSRLQRLLRRFLVRRADAFLAWGQPATEYLKALGARTERIFHCVQAIDNATWRSWAVSLDHHAERTRLDLRGTVFLAVGRALPLKGLRNLLEAWSRLPADLHERSTLAIVGDGEELPRLRSLAAAYGLTNIHFAGKQTPSELARYYAAADIFVLSSLAEVWGLVVNEAMSFGLPVLASQYAGASQELVKPEVGRLFDPADIAQFAQVLREWAEAPPPKNRHACWQIIDRVSFDHSVEGITGMLRSMGIT